MLTVKVRLVDKNVNSHVGRVMVMKAMNHRSRLGNMVKIAKNKLAVEPIEDDSVSGDRDDTRGTVVFCMISLKVLEASEAISEAMYTMS